jgi:hypothetical protein
MKHALQGSMKGAFALSVLSLSALSGCAQNAVFELHVRLPTANVMPGARFIRIQVQPTTASFDTSFDSGGTAAIELPSTSDERGVMVSIPATGAELTEGLHVKVLLCRDEACTTPLLERWYDFERVFYRDHYTCFDARFDLDLAMPTLDQTPVEVGICDIAGCLNSTSGLNNCTGTTHDCLSTGATRESTFCNALLQRDVP